MEALIAGADKMWSRSKFNDDGPKIENNNCSPNLLNLGMTGLLLLLLAEHRLEWRSDIWTLVQKFVT